MVDPGPVEQERRRVGEGAALQTEGRSARGGEGPRQTATAIEIERRPSRRGEEPAKIATAVAIERARQHTHRAGVGHTDAEGRGAAAC